MPLIDIREFRDDSFVVHFGGERRGIDTTTFAQALLGFSEAMRALNRELNPGFELDVLIEAVGPGSFRAKLRIVQRSAGNLFSKEGVGGMVLIGLFTNLIYDKVFPSPPPQITINTDAVVVDYGSTKVIVPKEVFEAKKKVENKTAVNQHIAETVEALNRDPGVTSFGITKSLNDQVPDVEFPRALFPEIIANTRSPLDSKNRSVDVDAKLTVIKAILQRTSRKWEFYWNGIPISAPIRDRSFFDRLISNLISLRHGDTFDAILRIHQKRDEFTGAWVNQGYEVMRVLGISSRRHDQIGWSPEQE